MFINVCGTVYNDRQRNLLINAVGNYHHQQRVRFLPFACTYPALLHDLVPIARLICLG